jgi:uncharacterized repeat protein (TIGR01451 family)
MFVMALAIIGIGMIYGGNGANAATVGQQLTSPESGWRRYDDTYTDIKYNGSFGNSNIASLYNGAEKASGRAGDEIKFYANCSEIRIIASKCDNRYNANHMEVLIDGVSVGKINMYYPSLLPQVLLFNYNFGTSGIHYIQIKNIAPDGRFALLDAIDINKDGKILPWINESLSLDKDTLQIENGELKNLIAKVTSYKYTTSDIIWTSSDESVVTVDENGDVKAVGLGTATITAQIKGTRLISKCTVTVSKKAEQESISLNKSNTNLTIEDSETLIATTTPAGISVKWSSSDTSVATVDSNGKVTAIGAGTATITATTADGSNLSASCLVTVLPKGNGPTPAGSEYITNIAHAKGTNTNNPGGEVTIIFHGTADTTLSVVKTADVKDVWIGDNFTYTLVITNTGTKTAKAVVVNDPAPNHIDFNVSGVTTTQGNVDSSSTSKNIIVNVGDILPGGTVTIKVPATVIA